MSSAIKHFLLVFDHSKAELVHEQEFGTDSKAAVRAYGAMELSHRDDPNIDILLVGSDSLDTVKVTHANYFDGSASLNKYLVGI